MVGLPRTRGDGPRTARPGQTVEAASPHTRGWTVTGTIEAYADTGFPAHAGMDPGPTRPRRRRPGLPRTRGDGPVSSADSRSAARASPHTRGWTLGQRERAAAGRGFPAHAGMDPRAICKDAATLRLPRTRGDGPGGHNGGWGQIQASPHTRGWTLRSPDQRGDGIGFPAHAGMDPNGRPVCYTRGGLPRTRGDGPPWALPWLYRLPASPHTRGWTRTLKRNRPRPRGFPAHAGMDRVDSCHRSLLLGLPRTRGDGPVCSCHRASSLSASPHTRGWTSTAGRFFAKIDGFPAHAGMDPPSASGVKRRGGLPRTRGDGPLTGGLLGSGV